MPEAMLYQRLDGERVSCQVCAHGCEISPGQTGKCGVRRNQGGSLQTPVYGKAAAFNIDPIEKKPLYHFLPGSQSLSIGTVGCNFKCPYCQNWEISQYFEEHPQQSGNLEYRGAELTPAVLVKRATLKGYESISFTYNEPAVFFEYAYDTAMLARHADIRTVFVSNGYLTPAALEMLAPVLDAINIDLKAFDDKFYREQCQARLTPVMECIEEAYRLGIWVEVTTLVIPGLNDSYAELSGIAEFVAGIDDGIPWHVTAFHPDYRMPDRQPTSLYDLQRAVEAGRRAGLRFVYKGNVADVEGSTTRCPSCGKQLVRRSPFSVSVCGLDGGACQGCGTPIEGVWR